MVGHVEEVEAHLHALVPSGLYRLNDTEVHLLIARQAVSVRDIARVGGPLPAGGDQVGRKQGTGCRHPIFDAGRVRVSLVMIEMNVVAVDECELIGREIELRRANALAEGLRRGEVAVKRPVPDFVAEKHFDPFDDPVVIIEGRQDDRRAELSFV